ncbi:MAG: 50S ribosomal protein L11 methyltransferase [Bacteroidota bacterium]|nr:50S ribosomal protein L11 methyltransferase [Bacteroidota bacterium]
MNYLELTFQDITGTTRDILEYRLSELGFEGFNETHEGLLAYVSEPRFLIEEVDRICGELGVTYTRSALPEKDWNETWEKNFTPVVIDGKCRIHAPFHEPSGDYPYDIIIEPKMSFGTGHHETTSLIISFLLDMDLSGKRILDMGCGTGILSILAEKMGAESVLAVDNEEWAYKNAQENILKNNSGKIIVKLGETDAAKGSYDIILANINRNVLMEQIPFYSGSLANGGILIMSGFFIEDLPLIIEGAKKYYFVHKDTMTMNLWAAAKFIRE